MGLIWCLCAHAKRAETFYIRRGGEGEKGPQRAAHQTVGKMPDRPINERIRMTESTKSAKLTIEGKEYEVKDGDVIEFRFNV